MQQLNAITSASLSIKNSARIKKLLEVILAFGNYLNSSKRGAAYGFKLQTLDTVSMSFVPKKIAIRLSASKASKIVN